MADDDRGSLAVTRRDLLKLGVAGLGSAITVRDLVAPAPVAAQTPKRGGVFRFPGFDPPNFDPHQNVHWWTFIYLSLTHSSLLRHKAGPGVTPGTLPVEGDLAESWTQPNDTTYEFKLRKGVRWHNKPPVSGRELTAEDVKYTYERAMSLKGNPNRAQVDEIERVEALDRYTVRFTTKEPFAWFLDSAALAPILPREAADKDGMFKKPESVIGTGPWMLERYEPNVRLTWVRHPDYFLGGLPNADGVEASIESDAASRLARWLGGQFDFGGGPQTVVRRQDLETVRKRKPNLQTAEFVWMIASFAAMKLDQEPFRDVRVRRAVALSTNLKEVLAVSPLALGQGVPVTAVPAALTEWAIPIDQLTPQGRRLYEYDPAAAARLLAEAGHPRGVKVPFETASFGSDWMDAVQVYVRGWKAGGIDTELKVKETGAFVSSAMLGRFERMMLGVRGGQLYPDPYLGGMHLPGQRPNSSGVNDPKLTEMIRAQRRTFDAARRRDIVWDIQRHCAEQAYYVYGPAARVVAGWEPYVRNYAPNLGNDVGGRLMAAWLDR